MFPSGLASGHAKQRVQIRGATCLLALHLMQGENTPRDGGGTPRIQASFRQHMLRQ